MHKPSDRWPTQQDLNELVGAIRDVTLNDKAHIVSLAEEVQTVLADRATYADTLAVFASLINMIQADDDMPRGIAVLALGAACGVPVKRVGESGAIEDVYQPSPIVQPLATAVSKPVSRGHLRLVKAEETH